jgi:DNA-binding CsgD family transcriptional regulator
LKKNCKILIAHNQYIIIRGICAIATQADSLCELISVSDKDCLAQKIFNTNPDILIIDETNKSIISTINVNDVEIIFVTNQNIATDEHIISIYDEKNRIIKIINSAINKVNNSNKTKESNELTDRETEIVKHIALGETNQEIAESLFISMHTVISHRKNITKKLGIKTISGITVYALLNKLVNTSDIKK